MKIKEQSVTVSGICRKYDNGIFFSDDAEYEINRLQNTPVTKSVSEYEAEQMQKEEQIFSDDWGELFES